MKKGPWQGPLQRQGALNAKPDKQCQPELWAGFLETGKPQLTQF